ERVRMQKSIKEKLEFLKEGERLDDLLFNDMHIIQNKERYCFTSDAVLLANFAKSKRSDKVVDLCSGSGIVGILFYAKNLCKSMTLVEMQKDFCDMEKRSIELNSLDDKIEVKNVKVQDFPKTIESGSFDVVLCNPPYKKTSGHKITEKKEIAVCKYEMELKFDELCECVSKILKFGGKFYFIHDSSRLVELITTLKKYSLEPKVIELCYPSTKIESNVVMIEAVKNGKSGCKILKTTN
ncbi:MAG: methyltransferase, partial [Clostridiales bacterium]|nr:methyltransferase [Candidatus Apopatousia equi]